MGECCWLIGVRGWVLWGLAVETRCRRGVDERLGCVLQRVRGVLRDLILGLGGWGDGWRRMSGWIVMGKGWW